MQKSALVWNHHTTSTSHAYNPEMKIRSLINNLDAELSQLCQQCAVPPSRSAQMPSPSIKASSLLNSRTNNDGEMGAAVQTRTLASIYRAKVIDAYRGRRIFTVYGNYHTVRRALLRRGWLEKLPPGRFAKLQGLSEEVLLQHARRGNDYETVAISKIINHFPAFFIWQPKNLSDQYLDVLPFRNRVRRGRKLDFSTKVGLIGCAEQEHWFHENNVAGMSYPRFYRLSGENEERDAFVEDFRQTQCRSLLRLVIEHRGDANELVDEEQGKVLLAETVSFALARITKQVNDMEHRTLDEDSGTSVGAVGEKATPAEWQNFLSTSTEVLQGRAKFKGLESELVELAKMAAPVMEKLVERRPDYNWDGSRNLWILKPGYQCRGIGIIIRCMLDDIVQWAVSNPNRRYIAQKYVERPLLIYRTKFDIRQYMLLTIGAMQVRIWLYRDCYLRFSSQEFSVEDLRESIHLTNNSVQKKYKNKMTRDSRLPKNNMWSLEQFQTYLRSGAPERTWEDTVYAGFRRNLIAVVLASLDETEFVENVFELYGCDFMIDEHYNPILIEINSTPDLSASTEVTARICPQALRDLIKVVVDLPRNSRASTGLFELIYEVDYRNHVPVAQRLNAADNRLDVCGKAMTLLKPTKRFSRRVPYCCVPGLKRKEGAQKLQSLSSDIGVVAIKMPKKPRNKRTRKTITRQTAEARVVVDTVKADTPAVLCEGKLQSLAKEALALRYTLPK